MHDLFGRAIFLWYTSLLKTLVVLQVQKSLSPSSSCRCEQWRWQWQPHTMGEPWRSTPPWEWPPKRDPGDIQLLSTERGNKTIWIKRCKHHISLLSYFQMEIKITKRNQLTLLAKNIYWKVSSSKEETLFPHIIPPAVKDKAAICHLH